MENLNDSPARFEDNEHYLKDPTSPSSKPYSSKQKEANARWGMRETLYHEKEGRRVFNKDEVEEAKKNGWRDVPFVHPRHPKKKVEAPVETDELKLLREEAEKMGIEVDKRWGSKRLQDEMLKASK